MYTLLPSSPDAEHPDKGQALRKLMADVLIIVACISAIATSALSIFLALRLNRAESEKPLSASYGIGRRPSTYINLHKLYDGALEQGDRLPSFHNFAHVVFQVNNDDPRRALLEDHREYYSSEGFIYPDDRHEIDYNPVYK
ncbi:hypothetical protein D9757_011899 [Collybiopsis confluens]|uniref:Uncharacterized protein n=1 Tax=Collybiopsis confluens TaxID=2823264 RepID=A0A8H5LP80_9AGAR|nr:hypothetical protein D9757_011899 [Collybiopsis confluens]